VRPVPLSLPLSLPLPLSVSLPVPGDGPWGDGPRTAPTPRHIEVVTVWGRCVRLCVFPSSDGVSRCVTVIIVIIAVTATTAIAVHFTLIMTLTLSLCLCVLQTCRHLIPRMTPVPHTIKAVPPVPVTPRHPTLSTRIRVCTAVQTIAILIVIGVPKGI
jgi:hypothetical protein